jgi:NADPH2:quinone reductase
MDQAVDFRATCLRLSEKVLDAGSIAPRLEKIIVKRGVNDVVVEIKAAGVNPSDVKAATGLMPYAVFPRTPGRDYAGIVVDGPSEMIGREVFGSSGDLGIRRDGTHASHLIVEAESVVAKPSEISMEEAAGIGVPFVTAVEGLRRAGMPGPHETVVIMGVNGKVGQAAAQIATWMGAKVIGVQRNDEGSDQHTSGNVELIDATKTDVVARIRELTNGKGADLIFNTVGDPYFLSATKSLALGGRQILIAAINKVVEFNILEFYRGRHAYFGVDTLALSSGASGDILRSILPGFASGHLKPYPIPEKSIFSLSEARAAYLSVAASSRDRVIIRP